PDPGRKRIPPCTCSPVGREQYAVVRPPHDEGPVGAVPEPTDKHSEHQVAISLERGPTAAAKRNVQIVPHTGRKRDMPPTPEFRRVLGLVGGIEVDRN